MEVRIAAGELLDRLVWERACDMLGLNPRAVNEGLMDSGDKVTLTLEQAAELGLLVPRERERPHRIDPPGCGCTDCLVRWSVPLDMASVDHVFAMRAGEVEDATSEEFQTVTTEDESAASVTIRARRCGREWTREVREQ